MTSTEWILIAMFVVTVAFGSLASWLKIHTLTRDFDFERKHLKEIILAGEVRELLLQEKIAYLLPALRNCQHCSTIIDEEGPS
jgi:hypothetical protein